MSKPILVPRDVFKSISEELLLASNQVLGASKAAGALSAAVADGRLAEDDFVKLLDSLMALNNNVLKMEQYLRACVEEQPVGEEKTIH